MVGVPRILDSLWKVTNAIDASTATQSATPEASRAMAVGEISEMEVDQVFGGGTGGGETVTKEMSEVATETVREEDAVTEKVGEVSAATKGVVEVAAITGNAVKAVAVAEKVGGAVAVVLPAPESFVPPTLKSFGGHQSTVGRRTPRQALGVHSSGDTGNTSEERIFNVQATQLPDPFLIESVHAGKKRAISAIATPRKSGRERKPSQKVQDGVQIWEDEAMQKILNYVRQSEKSQRTMGAQMVKLQESVNQMVAKVDQQSKEIGELKAQLSQLQVEPLSPRLSTSAPTHVSGSRSYTDTARSGMASQASQALGLAQKQALGAKSIGLSRSQLARSPHLVVDTSKAVEEVENLTQVREKLQSAMKQGDHTKEVGITGITRERDPHRCRVLFGSEKEAETARKFDDWVNRAVPDAFLVRLRLVSVKVDHVFKSSVLSDTATTKLRDSLASETSKDNGIKVSEVKWLSGVDFNKRYGSMVIRLADREEAEAIKAARSIEVCGETGYTAEFVAQQGPIRCYKCQSYGHRAATCDGPVKCSICAEDHHYSMCSRTIDKCGACGGPHRAMEKCCPVYQLQKESHPNATYYA